MKHVDAGEYNAAYDRQKGLCAICQKVPQPIKGRGRRQGFMQITTMQRAFSEACSALLAMWRLDICTMTLT